MLDKSVPFYEIYMRRSPFAPLPECPLPKGYRFAFYRDGDEKSWAEIETSVAEFDRIEEAASYFTTEYLPERAELYRRMLFVESPEGEKVATATAWWDAKSGERIPWLHWVSVMPGFQGKGLGKAVVREAIRVLLSLEGDHEIVLHTQTWSHRAVGIYEMLGFKITSDPKIGAYDNTETENALKVLKKLRKKSR